MTDPGRFAERIVRSMSLGTARLLVAEIEAESTARIAELEAALGGVLGTFHIERTDEGVECVKSVWLVKAQVEAWRDTLAGGK